MLVEGLGGSLHREACTHQPVSLETQLSIDYVDARMEAAAMTGYGWPHSRAKCVGPHVAMLPQHVILTKIWRCHCKLCCRTPPNSSGAHMLSSCPLHKIVMQERTAVGRTCCQHASWQEHQVACARRPGSTATWQQCAQQSLEKR